MIKYLGSKRLLLPQILAAVQAVGGVERVLDAFSGTARVGHALKQAGYRVTANDHLTYAHVIASCYVQADRSRVIDEARRVIDELSGLAPKPGYFTETFCERARFFQPHNGARIDAMREAIEDYDLDHDVRSVVLTSLLEAADRVDSTTGVQMAYLKSWAKRSFKPIELRVPDVLEGPGEALHGDARDAVAGDFDLVYLDPPYNQHSYKGNYHVWETLARWDAPEAYGVAQKRLDCKEYKNAFNSKVRIADALSEVIAAIKSPHMLVSFNNEGHLDRTQIEEMLRDWGQVEVIEVDYKRYVGAQIGIHSPSGERVGKVSHLRNKELLFVASRERAVPARTKRAVLETLAQP